VECPACHYVTEDKTYELQDTQVPMPCCGSTADQRKSWPNGAAWTLLSVVQNRDTLIDDGEQVRFVFLASMLESLLEAVLFRLVSAKQGDRQAERVLAGIHGAAKLRRSYDKHSDLSLADLLRDTAHGDFLIKWDQVIRLRNKFAHGVPVTVGQADKKLADEVEDATFWVFVAVHNDVVRQGKGDGV
jgi:hypothetical protein